MNVRAALPRGKAGPVAWGHVPPLLPGANLPLPGQHVRVRVEARELAGAAVVVEGGGAPRTATASEPGTALALAAGGATLSVDLDAVPAGTERLRLLVWTAQPTRLLEPARARIELDGAAVAEVELPAGGGLRAAELVELYRRHGAWKVRAVASGWVGGPAAMAAAVGIPVPAAPAPARPVPVSDGSVGPALLRGLVDEVVGPGPRTGDHDHLGFTLGGVEDVMLALEPFEDVVTVTAVVPLGAGSPRGRLAEAALRASGEAPMGRVAFSGGKVFASASTTVGSEAVDTAVLKALLAEAWSTGVAFNRRAGASFKATPLAEKPPRELQLGIVEDLGEPGGWTETRQMLLDSQFMPLVDAPQACLAPDTGTLWLGPVALAGTPRAWSVLCERVLRTDVVLDQAAWERLAGMNTVSGSLRLGVVEEAGATAPAVVLNSSALQVRRGQPRRDLEIGLRLVDDQAGQLAPTVRELLPGRSDRDNLPWPAGRTWNGPGREVTEDPLARELAAGGTPAPDLLERALSRTPPLRRGQFGFLAHLALLEAEKGSAAGLELARGLVQRTPVRPTEEDRTAVASVHVRLNRLVRGSSAPPPAPADPAPPRRRRWFG